MKLKKYIFVLVGVAAMTAFAAEVAREHAIVQKDREFSQTEITIKLGETLVFTNSDSVTHNVFSNSKFNSFNIKVQKPGEASTVQFKEEGVTEVRCAIHPKMKLIVNVKN
jgi:plastocyanin